MNFFECELDNKSSLFSFNLSSDSGAISKKEKRVSPSKPFFVKKTVLDGRKKVITWLDIATGIEYNELDIPFENAQHGLCEKFGGPVFKLFQKRMVLAPINGEERRAALAKLKPVTVYSHDNHKHRVKWTFEPLAIYEALKGIDEGLDEMQLATRVGAPLEAIKNLLAVIERKNLMEKVLGGDFDNGGNNCERRVDYTQRPSYDLRY